MATAPATDAAPPADAGGVPGAAGRRISRPLVAFVAVPSVVTALLLVTLYLVLLPMFPALAQYYFAEQADTYAVHRIPLVLHIVTGAVALVVGAVNLVTSIGRRRLRAHRALGRVYAVAVSVSAVFAAFLAFHAYGGSIPFGSAISTGGFLALAIAWVGTLVLALHAIVVRHDARRHRFWMTVCFSLTFAAVTLRAQVGIALGLDAAGLDAFDTLYPLVAWTCWVPNALAAMLLVRRLERQEAARTLSRK